jgi:hypothetical protein
MARISKSPLVLDLWPETGGAAMTYSEQLTERYDALYQAMQDINDDWSLIKDDLEELADGKQSD